MGCRVWKISEAPRRGNRGAWGLRLCGKGRLASKDHSRSLGAWSQAGVDPGWPPQGTISCQGPQGAKGRVKQSLRAEVTRAQAPLAESSDFKLIKWVLFVLDLV